MGSTELSSTLRKLAEVVHTVGLQMLGWRGTAVGDGNWIGAQLKTLADLRAHSLLTERLHDLDRDIPVISEEDVAGQTASRPARYWLVDPIDGTASFANGYNGFVTQAALIEDARPALAAIFAPALNRLYLAAHGQGATCNGQPLARHSVEGRRILIDNDPRPTGVAAAAFEAMKCTGYLESGSISLKICRVADGGADIFIKDVVVRDWDIAAPALVIAASGGYLCGLDGWPYVFGGDWEKPGVVATATADLAGEVIAWYQRRRV